MADPAELIPALAPDEALRRLAAPGAVIVDVREAEELARTGRLAGALHLPLGALPARAAAELPRDRPILLYCAAGIRSGSAARWLRERGWIDAANLGGFAALAAAGARTEPGGA